MNSFSYKANALLTFSLTILALMCAMASLTDHFNYSLPTATVQILNVNRF
ncbi:putative signal peptidase complex subunit 3 [Helianthus annuus]|uniref:Signal peptidase complex subunit 3 n=1 Tax=Helianthus annuus TaxID=4232 RepID=A0A9K3P040_HELAN|nr:putative signal peptidase complex subunit 3 [Helianthus annuus]